MAGVAAITSFLPLVVSSAIFSTRRTNKALEADNPMVSIMNLDIATGQVFKAGECAMNIAQDTKNKTEFTLTTGYKVKDNLFDPKNWEDITYKQYLKETQGAE